MGVGKDHFRVLDCDNVTTIAPCCGKAKKAKMLPNVARFTHKPVQHVAFQPYG